MVSQTIRATVDALSVEDRVWLLEYLERTTDPTELALTDEQLAAISRRDAELEADPSIGIPQDTFMAALRAKWA